LPHGKRDDTCAGFLTVRKTEENQNVWPQGVLCSSFGRSLGAWAVLFEVMGGVRKRSFFIRVFLFRGNSGEGGFGEGGYALVSTVISHVVHVCV
jgi:hypothetical protein